MGLVGFVMGLNRCFDVWMGVLMGLGRVVMSWFWWEL